MAMRASQLEEVPRWNSGLLMGKSILTARVVIYPALVLTKAYKYRSCASFIWELNNQRRGRNPH